MDEVKATLLVVDDEESIRSGVSRKLQTERYDCLTAADGKEALEKLAMQIFDLVLMDIKMPGMSGIEVLPEILSRYPDTGVVMITAVSDTQTAVEAMKLGAYDYVTKPFDVDNLVVRVEKALERRKLVLENKDYQYRLEHMVEQQVGEIRQCYGEAMQALAREEMALEQLSGISGKRQGADCESVYFKMAKILAQTVEMRETYCRGHSERVALLAKEIARHLDCSDEMIRDIQLAALVHDIGKIVIPEHILYKPGRLTSAEYSEVKAHPISAVDIIRHVDRFKEIIPMVENHHEWYNGKGYPGKLKSTSISLGARILSVANAYDAMTSPRPHRPRLTHEETVKTLRKGAGSQWDPFVVDAFIRTLEQEPEASGISPATK